MRSSLLIGFAAALSLASADGLAGAAASDHARVSLDVKDASILGIVRVLVEVGGFQVVFDPGISCTLTLKLTQVSWATALDTSLRTCGLAQEEEGGIMRVAAVAKLREEAQQRRTLAEERRAAAPRSIAHFRLSHARAEQMAPIVRHWLAPRGNVVYDARTNTLVIVD
jgi:type IV pilus assembly protein PilQ